MSIELRPLGVACNLSCTYCYQDPQRDSGNFRQTYDIERMKEAVTRTGGPFILFGGEPLLVPTADLEELFRWGLEKYGQNTIQTNGALLEDAHVDMFRRYNVSVGISVDGPGELNDVRRFGKIEQTREATARTLAAIERLCREWRPPGLIVTLHRGNATGERLPVLAAWFRRLDALGIKGVRLHVLEVDSAEVRAEHALSARENVEALVSLSALQDELKNIRFDVFDELGKLLTADDSTVSCVWRACDPLTTESVQGIEGNGQASNCGRTNKDGIDFVKADERGYERYLALWRTPQEDGGCRGCRFFSLCKGQCPGTAIDGDWRNRTEHCDVWKSLFTREEKRLVRQGKVPVTLSPNVHRLEARLLAEWARGSNARVGVVAMADAKAGPAPSPAPVEPPSFARMSWVSNSARALWQPRLERVLDLDGELALLDATADETVCTTAWVAPASVYPLTVRGIERGIAVELIDAAAMGERIRGPATNEASATRRPAGWLRAARHVVIGAPHRVAEYRRLLAAGDVDAVDELSGVPACCRNAVRDGGDPLWAAALAGGAADGATITLPSAPLGNHLLRRLGVAPLPYLPCSVTCAASLALAARRLGRGRAAGLGEAIDGLLAVLSWPASWTALHGIAELKTPVLKLITETPWTGRRLIVLHSGAVGVEGAGRGLRFPFAAPRNRRSLMGVV